MKGRTVSETKPAAHSDRSSEPGIRSRRQFLIMLGLGAGGGVAIGGTIGALLGHPSESGQQLETVPTGSLADVAGTLAPQDRQRLIDEARRCREPLGRLAIWHSPETRGGIITVTSGAYRSPPFQLTTSPSLVALPFPAPYSTGRGQLIITGEADNLMMALRPTFFARVVAPTTIDVWWTPLGGCP